jgi:hypothetical protein
MTPKTDTDLRYAGRSGAGVTAGRQAEVATAQEWDHRRASVAWSHVLPLAVVLAFANTFWMIVLRGAVGAIERTGTPFTSWLHESTLLVPVYVVAVLAAFRLAQRWFGPRPRGIRAVASTGALVAAATTAAGALLMMGSMWFDFRFQVGDLRSTGQMHMSCDSVCVTQRIRATLNLELKGAWIGALLMLVTSLVVTAMVLAFRGGVIRLARDPRPASPLARDGLTLVLAAGLLGSAVIHAAVVPAHLSEWWVSGVAFVALALGEVAVAAALLTRGRVSRAPALVAAIVLSAVPLVVWVMSLTSGLPLGPAALDQEWVGVVVVLAGVLELTTLTIAILMLRRRGSVRAWTPYGLAIGLCAVVAATLIGVGGASHLPGGIGAFSALGEHQAHHGVQAQG